MRCDLQAGRDAMRCDATWRAMCGDADLQRSLIMTHDSLTPLIITHHHSSSLITQALLSLTSFPQGLFFR
jgi:hypothetical protein